MSRFTLITSLQRTIGTRLDLPQEREHVMTFVHMARRNATNLAQWHADHVFAEQADAATRLAKN